MEETIKSVLSQTYQNFEYVIKDGVSSDRTVDIARRLTDGDNRAMIIQGKDTGIYDAMNIAVLQASGEYVLFLNAGDKFCDENVLSEIAKRMHDKSADVYYGNMIQVDIVDGSRKKTKRIYNQNSVKWLQYAIGRCICHQVIFARKELLLEKVFDIKLSVCADREWQMCCLKKGYCCMHFLIVVSEVLADGYSKNNEHVLEKEVRICIWKHCRNYLFLYDSIMFLKKNLWVKKILQKLDELSAVKKLGKDE